MKKAKLRLETICLLLAQTAQSRSEKEKQQSALANVFEEIVFSQGNKFDSQSLRLLFDYQWQNGSVQTTKLQDELAQVKARFESQTRFASENKDLRDQLLKQKTILQD